ncbi:hypothetical protein RND71_016866 [Anisodus tanguticus]|uniref:Ribosomal protein S6 n=1 Tax=Anisodus tanguticus TaxID=243964 RepID=A0AAE1SA10_9SOLA|nr:hypothetical protein RND71_016866 [Anisodus tanguticus]
MASSSSSIILPSLTSTLSSSKPSLPFNFIPFTKTPKMVISSVQILKAQTLEFSGSFFESGFGENNDEPPTTPWSGISNVEDKEEPQCPPGLRPYETMAVLRPDMSEDERLALTQKYEELLVVGGGMYVEVFNRGVIPLAYSIRRKNKAGETNTYLDGIYLLFAYFTKPESISALEATLIADDDVIRSSTFKIRKRKY